MSGAGGEGEKKAARPRLDGAAASSVGVGGSGGWRRRCWGDARAGEVGEGERATRRKKRKKKAAAAIGFISIAAAMNSRRPPPRAGCMRLVFEFAARLGSAWCCCAAACSYYFFENN